MKYEIDKNDGYSVSLWTEESSVKPLIYQPTWPDGTAWSSFEEAQSWAELMLESHTNPDSEILPGVSPAEPTRLRVPPKTISERLSDMGISIDELKQELGLE